MRCDAVIRELAVPTDERDSTALAEHVAHCPACTAWAKRAAGLDHLWEATRPPEPSAEVWDALWGRLARSLDASMPDEVESFTPVVLSRSGSPARDETQLPSLPRARSRTRRWAAIGLIGLAQAAAVLLAVGLYWQGLAPSQPPQLAMATDPMSSPSASQPTVAIPADAFATVVEEGSLVVIDMDPKPRTTLVPIFSSPYLCVIRAAGKLPTVVDFTPQGTSFGVDDWYLAFNVMEALADNPVVAME